MMYREEPKKPITLKRIPVSYLIYDKATKPMPGDSLAGCHYFDILKKQVLKETCEEVRKVHSAVEVFQGVWVCTVTQEKAVYICLTKSTFVKYSTATKVSHKANYLVSESNVPKLAKTLKGFVRFEYFQGNEMYFKQREYVKESKILISVDNIAPGVFTAETSTEKYLIVF